MLTDDEIAANMEFALSKQRPLQPRPILSVAEGMQVHHGRVAVHLLSADMRIIGAWYDFNMEMFRDYGDVP